MSMLSLIWTQFFGISKRYIIPRYGYHRPPHPSIWSRIQRCRQTIYFFFVVAVHLLVDRHFNDYLPHYSYTNRVVHIADDALVGILSKCILVMQNRGGWLSDWTTISTKYFTYAAIYKPYHCRAILLCPANSI